MKTWFLSFVRELLSERRFRESTKGVDGWRTVVDFRGCKFFAGSDNKIEISIAKGDREYDRDNFLALDLLVNRGDICFDVGANIGVYSVKMAALTGSPENIHSFEPVEHIRNRFARNAKLNSFRKININDFALGANSRVENMYQVKKSHVRGGTSTFVENENIGSLGSESFDVREVAIQTMDSYVEERSLPGIDFIKIDVEGFEWEVLQGGVNVISRFKPIILMEFDKTRHERLETTSKFREMLNKNQYEVYEFSTFSNKLVLFPFDFTSQPRNRNILCIAG